MPMTLSDLRARTIGFAPDDYDKLVTRRGSEIKSIGGGRLSGYLVVWGHGEPGGYDRSKMKDYFLKGVTKLGRFVTAGLPVYLHHGLLPGVDDLEIGEAKCTPDDYGMAIDARMNTDLPVVRKALAEMAAATKAAGANPYGWSSGACSHLCRRKAETNSKGETVHRLLAFPIHEASLTASPAEIRAIATLAPERKFVSPDDPVIVAAMKNVRAHQAEQARTDRIVAEGLKTLQKLREMDAREGAALLAETQRVLRRCGLPPIDTSPRTKPTATARSYR